MSVIIQPLVASCKPVSTSAWNLSPRTIPEDQNEEESDDYQLMFKHFKENKVEIASAITKPFPFLMSLRDRDFISEQKFQEYQETCKNLVPVERVVYDVLSNVQKKFSRDLLKVIFSKTHLKAYPDLKETLKHFFLNVSDSHRTHQRINGRNVEERPRLPSVVREASKTNDEQAEEMLSLPQCNGGEGSSSCEQTCDEQEPQDDLPSSLRQEAARRKKRPNWSNSKRRLQKKKPRQDEMMGVPSPGHGVQEKLKAVSRRTLWKDDSSTNVKEVTKTLRARMRCIEGLMGEEFLKSQCLRFSLVPTLPQITQVAIYHPLIDPSCAAIQCNCSSIHLDPVLPFRLCSGTQLYSSTMTLQSNPTMTSVPVQRAQGPLLSHPTDSYDFPAVSQLWFVKSLPP
ncbi:SP140 nuclear body protein family member isoform X2 [Mus musculus]|uniref:SP140 nuclear body protein family member isoform X2 n=1 Tax=Mus musculus TaxID=10090 RepID=UPI0003D72B5B|nr:SP140 nuclear body protein family member isoform X2 [Mus musculus]|eukprot:XP_017177368.1 PREDICTED: SP140 nuclear body protein family member isoform X2 [Mus musculus]